MSALNRKVSSGLKLERYGRDEETCSAVCMDIERIALHVVSLHFASNHFVSNHFVSLHFVLIHVVS